MWLDRETGTKCYMLSARALHIAWGDTPNYWSWIPLTNSRFSEGAELNTVCWLEIWSNIDSNILSESSTYAAYFVFKIADESYGLDYAPLETSITIAGSTSTRKVCLQSYGNEHEGVPGSVPFMRQFSRRHRYPHHRNSVLPQERADGWMELEMGEFYNENGDNGEVCIRLMEVKGIAKGGLIVHGIEIRPKKDLFVHSSVRSLILMNSPPNLSLEHPKGHILKPSNAMSKVKPKGEDKAQAACSMMMADCEILRLPEKLLSAVISLTTPWDTCRAATVSKAFHTAADSDAVWSHFFPAVLMPLFSTYKVSPTRLSKKDMFLHFSNYRVPLAEKLVTMWFDRETGANCYMLSARKLNIVWADTSSYLSSHWRWIPITGSSFSEAAELLGICWLEIRGKIDSKMLSQHSTYAAYIVFKVNCRAYDLDYPYQKTSVSLGRRKSTRHVCLGGYDSNVEDCVAEFPHGSTPSALRRRAQIPLNVVLPRERTDGWKELEMGEFYNGEGDDGEVCISLLETTDSMLKVGLLVQGIEIRPKKQKGH